jgi:hypothetical protein
MPKTANRAPQRTVAVLSGVRAGEQVALGAVK